MHFECSHLLLECIWQILHGIDGSVVGNVGCNPIFTTFWSSLIVPCLTPDPTGTAKDFTLGHTAGLVLFCGAKFFQIIDVCSYNTCNVLESYLPGQARSRFLIQSQSPIPSCTVFHCQSGIVHSGIVHNATLEWCYVSLQSTRSNRLECNLAVRTILVCWSDVTKHCQIRWMSLNTTHVNQIFLMNVHNLSEWNYTQFCICTVVFLVFLKP